MIAAVLVLALASPAVPQSDQKLDLKSFKHLFTKIDSYNASGSFRYELWNEARTHVQTKFEGRVVFKFVRSKGFQYFISEKMIIGSGEAAHRMIRAECSFPARHFMYPNIDQPRSPDFGYVAHVEFFEDGSQKMVSEEAPLDFIVNYDTRANFTYGPIETLLTWLLPDSTPKRSMTLDESTASIIAPVETTVGSFLAGADAMYTVHPGGALAMSFHGPGRLHERYHSTTSYLYLDLKADVTMRP